MTDTNSSRETQIKIVEIIDKMLEPHGRSCFSDGDIRLGWSLPLDISEPTLHRKKSVFLAEKKNVDRALKSLGAAMDALFGEPVSGTGPDSQTALEHFVDNFSRRHIPKRDPQDAFTMLRRLSADLGCYRSSAFLIADFFKL